MKINTRRLKFIIPLSFVLLWVACGPSASDTSETSSNTNPDASKLFAAKCSMCHSFDEKRIGPALHGVYERWGRDDARLQAFIRNSAKVIADGDPYAVALYQQWNKSNMPSFESLTEQEMQALASYLKQ